MRKLTCLVFHVWHYISFLSVLHQQPPPSPPSLSPKRKRRGKKKKERQEKRDKIKWYPVVIYILLVLNFGLNGTEWKHKVHAADAS